MSYDIDTKGAGEWNITFNVGKFYRHFIHPEGLPYLHGMTGRQASRVLSTAVVKFATYRDFNDDAILDAEFSAANGWGSWEVAFKVMAELLEACIENPRKTVHVCAGRPTGPRRGDPQGPLIGHPMTRELIDRLDAALRDYDMELLGCYDVHPEAYENDVEAPEHRRAFLDHLLKLAHPALESERTARLAAEAERNRAGR